MVTLLILGIAPIYLVASLMLLGAMNQRKTLKKEIRQFSNIRRISLGRGR